MSIIYSEEWARENTFSTKEVEREIRKHSLDPADFFRDMTGSNEPIKTEWSGDDVLNWLGY